ncbi:MAG: hypothetical protein CM15mP74_13530 [Halieaceae bacterium]|nr:MAG: hypothetical protein CM15mP74_13530 [Halieaceae bacterium]
MERRFQEGLYCYTITFRNGMAVHTWPGSGRALTRCLNNYIEKEGTCKEGQGFNNRG